MPYVACVFRDDPDLFQMYDDLREQHGGSEGGAIDLELLMVNLEKMGQVLVQSHNQQI